MNAPVRETRGLGVALRYQPHRDVLIVQFASDAEELHAGAVMDDVFVGFDAKRLGTPVVVRIATPFWGRDGGWLTLVEQLVGEHVLQRGRELTERRTPEIETMSIDPTQLDRHRQEREAYHRALCDRARVAPPASASTTGVEEQERMRYRTNRRALE